MKKQISQMTLALATLSSIAFAEQGQLVEDAPINLSRITKTFRSPRGNTESCIALAKLPLAKYKAKDIEQEQKLCNLDFYNETLALCPKTWSTSAATIVAGFRDIDGKDLANSSADAESRLCGKNTDMDKLAKFKQTMNQFDTSGTYSGSSILYYHFSRALDADVNVPTAVYRTMDKDEHLERVAKKANPPASAKMNAAAWEWVRKAESAPATYNNSSDFFTADKTLTYGVLLKDKGERYKEEIQGIRSSWGEGQNYDFQKTPAFLALKSAETTLQGAISKGYSEAIKEKKIQAAFPDIPSDAQMIRWMNEVAEIAILDYIFSQQDRVGNIDFRWYWTYVDTNGDVQDLRVKEKTFKDYPRTKMKSIPVPASIAAMKPVLIQKTFMGDNDAGGTKKYANWSKKTKMIEGFRHFNRKTYQRLIKLARDFKAQGPNYQVLLSETALLNAKKDDTNGRFAQMINNTIAAADIIEKSCTSGQMKLDLVSLKKAMKSEFEVKAVDAAKYCTVE